MVYVLFGPQNKIFIWENAIENIIWKTLWLSCLGPQCVNWRSMTFCEVSSTVLSNVTWPCSHIWYKEAKETLKNYSATVVLGSLLVWWGSSRLAHLYGTGTWRLNIWKSNQKTKQNQHDWKLNFIPGSELKSSLSCASTELSCIWRLWKYYQYDIISYAMSMSNNHAW